MSQPCADGGRRLCAGRCSDERRRWSTSAEVLLIGPIGHFVTVHRGFCPTCEVKIDSALDLHMVNYHLELELGQLWRCPVEWCTVWKGSVRDCLGHLNDKHGGSTFFVCFMRPDVDWYIGTVCIKIPFLTRHSRRECFLVYCPSWLG